MSFSLSSRGQYLLNQKSRLDWRKFALKELVTFVRARHATMPLLQVLLQPARMGALIVSAISVLYSTVSMYSYVETQSGFEMRYRDRYALEHFYVFLRLHSSSEGSSRDISQEKGGNIGHSANI